MNYLIALALFLMINLTYAEEDLYPYPGMPIVCQFQYGKFEGKITEIEPADIGSNHFYSFRTSHRIDIDHRIRVHRVELSEDQKRVVEFDRSWVNEHCQSARRDTGILISIFGRSGFSEGDPVECEGRRSTIAELRKHDLILLEDNYLFISKDCSLLDEEASAVPEENIVDVPRTSPTEDSIDPVVESTSINGASE